MTVPDAIPEKHQRIAEIVKKKYGLHVEKYTNRKKVVREVGRPFFDLINEAYAELFEFTKLTDRQIDYYVKIYLRLLRLDLLCVIKDSNNEVIGVGVALPSLNSVQASSQRWQATHRLGSAMMRPLAVSRITYGRTPFLARASFKSPSAAAAEAAFRKPRRVRSCGSDSFSRMSLSSMWSLTSVFFDAAGGGAPAGRYVSYASLTPAVE